MNRTLIPDELTTPAVVVERAVLMRNIAAMAAAMAGKRIDLRPHVKTHKIPEIAALQLEAGAVGITVATIGEAEAFADAGCGDVHFLEIADPGLLGAATPEAAAARAQFRTMKASAAFVGAEPDTITTSATIQVRFEADPR